MNAMTLREHRETLLLAMSEIGPMRRGSVSKQMLKVKHKGVKQPAEKGPYYLWQYYEHGKPVRRRLRTLEEAKRAQLEVANHKQFKTLCTEFVKVSELLSEAEHQETAAQEAVKKGLKPRSKKTLKSNGSSK